IYDMADPVGGVELISRLEFDGVHVWSLAVEPPFAYLASGDSGLIVVDLSDPAAPTEAARINLGARALSIFKSGDTVYVGFEESGIALIDVRVSASPLLLGAKPTAGGVLDMALRDSLLFIAQATAGAAIYDMEGWNLLSTIPTGHVTFSLALEGNKLFLAEGALGISVYDIRNPASPHRVGTLNTGGEARDIVSLGDTLLVADGYDGLLSVLFLGLGIDESSALPASVLEVWPNPFSSVLYFSRPVQARLYDASGRLQVGIRGTRFDASRLPTGVYFIRGKNWYCKVVKTPSSR
ncbi:T9SS type A sorting domain-containing protein, partial [candidate division WOR-3 bacterium]|nr:T9SS type A sorting domain-containing protein [candidate division WOR-3 bacterium]